MKFSIVTPTLNAAEFLPQTAQSILSQSGPFELQWIVVDGGSTDATAEIIRSLAAADSRITFIHEAGGQSSAINRGFNIADGDVLAWLNSDDLYTPSALPAVCDAFERNSRAAWVVGRCEIIDHAGHLIRPRVTQYKNRSLDRYSYSKLLRENFISQPAVFWRRDLWRAAGGQLDESLHYTMDYDLWLRLGKLADPLILPTGLAQFRLHFASKSGRVNREQFDEQYRVACRYFEGDRFSQCIHRLNVEKIVAAYRVMRAVGW